jgi:hypothetical protein
VRETSWTEVSDESLPPPPSSWLGRKVASALELWWWFVDVVVSQWLLELLLFAGMLLPLVIPWVSALFAWTVYRIPRTQVARCDQALRRDGDWALKHSSCAWALPLSDLSPALVTLRSTFQACGGAAHFPVRISFCRGDDISLSHAHGTDTAIIEVPTFRPFGAVPNHAALLSAVEDALRSFRARPLWWAANTTPASMRRPLFPMWDHYAEVRATLDPSEVFVNPWTYKCVLNDGGPPFESDTRRATPDPDPESPTPTVSRTGSSLLARLLSTPRH